MTIISAIFQQCALNPEKPALIENDRLITYRELRQQIQRVSALISESQPESQRLVIAIDRGINATVAILSAMNLGICYVPLDAKNPAQRKKFIIEDVNCQCILGIGNAPEWLTNQAQWIDILQLNTNQDAPNVNILPEAPGAILYTSGSTGVPKGVVISNRALQQFIEWMEQSFQISQRDHIASSTPFHFDLSIFDLFCSLKNGATVHFIPPILMLSPSKLTAWLTLNQISVWYTVPSILRFIALKGNLANQALPHLRILLFAGEVFPTMNLIHLIDAIPHVDFFNLYGPTETNVCCFWKVDRNRLQTNQPIPIGLPACASELNIDSQNNELLVKSDTNFSGYWQAGQLVEPRLKNGFYPTGDKVSLNEHNEFCYHGRLDRMMKCSGYRVEPAEIEHIILQCNGVIQCAVVGINDPSSGQRAAAAIVHSEQTTIENIHQQLKSQLPAYMQPSRMISVDQLPLLSNGKIDYSSVTDLLNNQ